MIFVAEEMQCFAKTRFGMIALRINTHEGSFVDPQTSFRFCTERAVGLIVLGVDSHGGG